jgi:hypothetical protein
MRWFRKKLKIEDKVQQRSIVLHHNNGSTTVKLSVTNKILCFLQDNLGRDAICVQEYTTINLREFVILEIEKKKNNGKEEENQHE